jgi:hypothetical protein
MVLASKYNLIRFGFQIIVKTIAWGHIPYLQNYSPFLSPVCKMAAVLFLDYYFWFHNRRWLFKHVKEKLDIISS